MRKHNFLKAVALTLCLALFASGTAFAATPGQALDAKEVNYGTLSRADQNILKGMFNAEEYAAMNEDVVKAVGKDANKLFAHFIKYGVFEGRGPSKSFNVSAYMSSYGDLQKAFGKDIMAYYRHYNNYGKKEKRELVTVEKAEAAGVVIKSVTGATKTVLPPSVQNPSSGASSSSSSSSPTTPATDVTANSISLSKTSIASLEVGQTTTVTIIPDPSTATDTYSASSDDTTVVTANVSGTTITITAVAAGDATITVESTRTGTVVLEQTVDVHVVPASTPANTTPATVEVAGDTSAAALVASAVTKTYSATVRNSDNEVLTSQTITWSLATGSTDGLTIADGTLNIPAGFTGGTAKIVATVGSVNSVEYEVTITAADTTPASVVVTGDTGATALVASAVTKTYSATVKNAGNEVLAGQTIAWSLATGSTDGLTIADGALNIPAGFTGGTAKIVATVGSVNSAEYEVTIAAADTTPATLSISGANSAQKGNTATYTAEVKNAGNEVLTGATIDWEVTETPDFSIDANGELTVPDTTEVTEVTITATVNGTSISGTKTVSISE